MTLYVGHFISLLLYIFTLYMVVKGFILLSHARLYGELKLLIPAFLSALGLQATTFLLLQAEWIMQDFNAVVGDATAYAWLAFDYFNGLALFTYVLCLNVWLGWHDKCNTNMHSRRKEDRE